MQLPSSDEIVMVAGTPPIRAKKARYYEDGRLNERILPPPDSGKRGRSVRADNWSALSPQEPSPTLLAETEKAGREAVARTWDVWGEGVVGRDDLVARRSIKEKKQ